MHEALRRDFALGGAVLHAVVVRDPEAPAVERRLRHEREISPQRLVHYRDNWYVDAWCHLRNGLRSFSIDAIGKAELLADRVKDVARAELDEYMKSGYGIFSGKKVAWAKLKFSPLAARWVASQKWHSKQKGSFAADGSYRLELPYADDRELVMDILKHGPDVEVLAPPELRARVREQLKGALRRY